MGTIKINLNVDVEKTFRDISKNELKLLDIGFRMGANFSQKGRSA